MRKELPDQAAFFCTLVLFTAGLMLRGLYAMMTPVPVAFGFDWTYPIVVGGCSALSVYTSRRLGWRAAAIMLNGIALFAIGCLGMGYIAQACFYTGRNFPLMDNAIAGCDHMLGFDWLAYMRFFDQRAWLAPWLLFAYGSIVWQPVVIIVCLAMLHDAKRIYAFLTAQMVALMLVCAIAAFVPVLGTFHYFGILPSDHPHLMLDDPERWAKPILWLREAKFATRMFADIGLVTFPSFHTVSAILYLWAAWRVPVVRWIALGLDASMLIATPLYGSHYLTDVLVGGGGSLVLIFITSYFFGLERAALDGYTFRAATSQMFGATRSA